MLVWGVGDMSTVLGFDADLLLHHEGSFVPQFPLLPFVNLDL